MWGQWCTLWGQYIGQFDKMNTSSGRFGKWQKACNQSDWNKIYNCNPQSWKHMIYDHRPTSCKKSRTFSLPTNQCDWTHCYPWSHLLLLLLVIKLEYHILILCIIYSYHTYHIRITHIICNILNDYYSYHMWHTHIIHYTYHISYIHILHIINNILTHIIHLIYSYHISYVIYS